MQNIYILYIIDNIVNLVKWKAMSFIDRVKQKFASLDKFYQVTLIIVGLMFCVIGIGVVGKALI